MNVGKTSSKNIETLLVSTAAGATGITVCQIAKNVLGTQKVIGQAGSLEQCRLLVLYFGCDVARNYKDENFSNKLHNVTPGYTDLFFGNAGGHVLDCALARMAKNGRIVSCGSVSSYDYSSAHGVSARAWSLGVRFIHMKIHSMPYLLIWFRQNFDSVSMASYSSTMQRSSGLLMETYRDGSKIGSCEF